MIDNKIFKTRDEFIQFCKDKKQSCIEKQCDANCDNYLVGFGCVYDWYRGVMIE